MNRIVPWIQRRWQFAALALAGLVVGGAVGAAALSGEDKTTTEVATRTVTDTDTRTRTRTVRRTRTVVRTVTERTGGSGGGGGGGTAPRGTTTVGNESRTFSGRNFRNFGTVRVTKKSTIEWRNDGDVFSIISETARIVSSRKKSGRATLQRGTYNELRVAAIGQWRVTIRPG